MIWVLFWLSMSQKISKKARLTIFVNNEVFHINNISSFGMQMAQKCNGPPEPMNLLKYKQQQQQQD